MVKVGCNQFNGTDSTGFNPGAGLLKSREAARPEGFHQEGLILFCEVDEFGRVTVGCDKRFFAKDSFAVLKAGFHNVIMKIVRQADIDNVYAGVGNNIEIVMKGLGSAKPAGKGFGAGLIPGGNGSQLNAGE